MAAQGLAHGPLGKNCLHVCADMQRLFAPGGPVPWAQRVLPAIEELAGRHAPETLFTRFIPAARPGVGPGMWARYYRRCAEVTLTHPRPRQAHVLPLDRGPPRRVDGCAVRHALAEKPTCEFWQRSWERSSGVPGRAREGCIVHFDKTHDALMELYHARFSEQVKVATVREVLDGWW
jgi:hypothetical protein